MAAPFEPSVHCQVLKHKSNQLILTKKTQTTSRVSLGFPLLRKVRIRTQAQYKTKHLAALTPPRKSPDAQRPLRSNKFTNDEVFALCRLCSHLQQPHRSHCMGKVRKIMQFRNITFPLPACPLNTCAASHLEFSGISLGVFLFTFLLASVEPQKFQPVRRCVQIRNQFSGHPTTGGHLLLQQNNLQHRFQVAWGFTFWTTVELLFFLDNNDISKRRGSSSIGGQNHMNSPYIGFRMSVFFYGLGGNCAWHISVKLDTSTPLPVC